MDLNETVVFVKVVQAGSFSRAAQQLGMPNSTVSARVSALERRLGTTLLQRTTRRLHLTEAGEAFFRLALQGVNEILNAEAHVSAGQIEPRGVLRVTAPIDMGDCFANLIPGFRRKYPKVGLEFVFTDQIVDLVADGVDIAIRAGELRDSSLIGRKLGSALWVPFASPAYLKTMEAPSHPKQLSSHSLLQFTMLGKDKWRFTSGRKVVTVPMSAQMIGNDVDLIKALTMSGHGIALLPTYACRSEVQQGRLVRILREWCAKDDPVHLVYPGQRFVPAKVRAFVDMAVDTFKQIFRD